MSSTAPKFTKRTHKKSKNGCSTCKLRRVKCDETHPKCTNCTRRGTECVYLASTKRDSPFKADDPDQVFRSMFFTDKHNVMTKEDASRDGHFAQHHRNHNHRRQIPSFSPSSTSSSSDHSSNHLQTTPRGTDFSLIPSVDSPLSNTSPEDQLNLFAQSEYSKFAFPEYNNAAAAAAAMLAAGTPANLEPFEQMNRELMTLPSNNAKRLFPTYLDNTKINTKLLEYFTTVLCYRLAPTPVMARVWASVTTVSYKFDHLYHMILSAAVLSLYYDNPHNKEAFLSFIRDDDYLAIEQLNYDTYVQKANNYESVTKSSQELFSFLASGMLHLLRFLLLPNATICDPSFYKKTTDICHIFEDVMPLIDKCLFASEDNMVYYSPFATPRIIPDSDTYFPNYLYQLCMVPACKETDNLLDYVTIEEIIDSDIFKDFKAQAAYSDPEQKNTEIDEMLRVTINILKREFVLVYNDSAPEDDALRVFVRFPSLVPVKFVILLNEHDQRCLIIVAHYLMLLGSLRFDRCLLPRESIVNELNKIDTLMDDAWRPWLDIPKAVVGC